MAESKYQYPFTDKDKPDFKDLVRQNISEKTVSTDTAEIIKDGASLEVRNRGCFITKCQLVDSESDKAVSILYSESDITTNKLVASHPMMPVSDSEKQGLGVKHGYPRWLEYHGISLDDDEDGKKQLAFQADECLESNLADNTNLGFAKVFKLGKSTLDIETIVHNNDKSELAHTSLGEHLYFNLAGRNTNGLRVDGHTLNELLGEGAEKDIMSGESRDWIEFSGKAIIDFPAGYSIKLSAETTSDQPEKIRMTIWSKDGGNFICFEPTLGFIRPDNEALTITPNETVSLVTSIELLSTSVTSSNR